MSYNLPIFLTGSSYKQGCQFSDFFLISDFFEEKGNWPKIDKILVLGLFKEGYRLSSHLSEKI